MARGKITRSGSSAGGRSGAADTSGPLRPLQTRTTTSPLSTVAFWMKEDELILDQPYQRGHVWEEQQKVALVKSILQGIPIGSVYLNRRHESDPSGYYVVDGKQRLSAINDFLTGTLRFPASWIASGDLSGAPDADGTVTYSDLAPSFRRNLEMSITFGVHETRLPDEAAERDLFDRLNFGGTPMADADRATS